MVIGIDLIVLAVCIAYWEYRYQTQGWGRGWMREPYTRLPDQTVELWDDDSEFDYYLPPRG
jgi:hypothetical protein